MMFFTIFEGIGIALNKDVPPTLSVLHCTCVHYIKIYIYCQTRGFFLESKDPDGVDSTFFTSIRQLFDIISFVSIFEDISKLYFVFKVVETKGEAYFIFLLIF